MSEIESKAVEGPVVDEDTQEHRYVVHGERDVGFSVIPEELEGEHGWGVRIDGVPEPSIVHDRPWPSVETARDAAIGAVENILRLDRMQREEQDRATS